MVISNPAESAQRQHTASANAFSFTFTTTCLFDIAVERWNLYLKATRAHSCLHIGRACYMHTATPPVLKVFTAHAGEIHATFKNSLTSLSGGRDIWSKAKHIHHNSTRVFFVSLRIRLLGIAVARRGDETRGDGLAGSPALPRSSMAVAAAVAPRTPLAAELTPSRRLQKYTQPAQAVNWLSRC